MNEPDEGIIILDIEELFVSDDETFVELSLRLHDNKTRNFRTSINVALCLWALLNRLKKRF